MARVGAGKDCLDCKDKFGKQFLSKGCLLVDVAVPVCRFGRTRHFGWLAQTARCPPPRSIISNCAPSMKRAIDNRIGRIRAPLRRSRMICALPHTKAIPLLKHSALAYILKVPSRSCTSRLRHLSRFSGPELEK
jgi:hypothetical protein